MLPRRRGKGRGMRKLLLLLVYVTCSIAATSASTVKPSANARTTTNNLTVTSSVESTMGKGTTSSPVKDCEPLGTLQNGVMQLSNANLSGSVANISCNDGFVVNGTCVQSATSMCQPSGLWSIPVPDCISIYDGVLFNISKNPFIETFADNITISCQPGTDLKTTSTIQSIEIRRAISSTSTWETIVTLNSTNTPIVNSSNDLAAKATVLGDFTSAKVLILTVNESLLVCEDAAIYQCYVSYNDSDGKCHREINKNFDGFFFPQNVDLEVTRNGTAFETSSSTDPAQIKVDDVIDINCTAKIGSDPNITIEWLQTTTADKLTPASTPSGSLSLGSPTNYHNCQYTRTSTIKHTVDSNDKALGNITYSCEVTPCTPDGLNTRSKISANRVFHGEIYVLCPRPSTPSHGRISIEGTNVSSRAFLTCDSGYVPSTGSASCKSSGLWSSKMTCDPVDCKNLTEPLGGRIIYYNSTLLNNTAEIICDEGYHLNGSTSLICEANGMWSETNSTCVPIGCKKLPPLDNGFVTLSNFTYINSTASFSCYYGYKLEGNATSTCLEEGWEYDLPVCRAIDCGTPTFSVINGKVDVSNGTKVNDTGEIECDSGYELIGNSEISCLTNGSWSEWTGNCSLIPCLNLSKPLHGYVKSFNWFEAQFDCDVGYVLSGNSTLFCKPGGWESGPPDCNPVDCGTPTFSVINGNFDVSNGTKVNDTGEIECDNGYELTGNSEISCLANGFWSEWIGNCSLKPCGNISKPLHGNIRSNDGFEAQIDCDDGYVLSRNSALLCTPLGWDSDPPDCNPKVTECPKLSVLKNGGVQLSNESYYQSTAQFSCDEGYNLVGRNTTECSAFGNWTNSVPACSPVDCGNWTNNDSYSGFNADITYNKDTTFDSTAIVTCKEGYEISKTTSSLAVICLANGTWSVASPPICKLTTCPIINATKNVTVEYSDLYRLFSSKASFKCSKNGTRIQGHSKVTCLSNGEWSGLSPTCIKIEVEADVKPCPENKDFHGTVWNSTQPGTIMTKECDGKGYVGEVSRQCTGKGEWKLPLYNCVRKDIEKIDKEIEAIKKNPSEEVVTDALEKLNNITKPSAKANSLYGGEIQKVTSILESIANISSGKGVNVTKEQTQSFLSTTSNLLDTSNTESWQSISQEPEAAVDKDQAKQKSTGAVKILDVVSKYTEAVASALNDTNKTVKASNLVLHVSKIDGTKDVSFDGQKYFNMTSSFRIPSTSLTGLKHVSSVIYKNLSGIMSTKSVTNGKEDNSSKEINSGVITVNIPDWKNTDNFKITLKLGHFQKKFSQKQCSFWNESIAAWDGRGCKMTNGKMNTEESECECDHLTNFAILMSPWIQNNVDTKAIDIISIVGCSVSLLALVLTVIAHVMLWRYMKSDRVVILLNLSVALVISYAIFLGGVDRTENKDACTAVAVLLQYIYLVVFFLMLAEGIEIAVTVLYVFSTQSRLKWLLPCAWLIPAAIVGISLGATQLKGYGNEQFCWLSVEGGLIWSFVAPALLIILVNFVLLILVMGAAFRTATLSQKSRSEKTKTGVKCLCVLLPIMGCTWVIGIFYVNESMAWIQYVFAVCNGLQGLVIFIFHCAFNPQLRNAFQRRKKKYFDSMLSTGSSGKRFSMPRASTKSSSNSYVEMSDAFVSEDTSTKRRSSREGNATRENVEMVSGAWQDSILEYQQHDKDL